MRRVRIDVFANAERLDGLPTPRTHRDRSARFCGFRQLTVLTIAVPLLASACATAPSSSQGASPSSLVLPADVVDQRGRFREIFCAVLEDHGASLPDFRPCDDALTRIGDEPIGTGRVVELGQSARHLVATIVPGVGWECISNWLDLQGTTADHLRRFGYDAETLRVDALSSSKTNARQIRDAIVAMKMESTASQPRLRTGAHAPSLSPRPTLFGRICTDAECDNHASAETSPPAPDRR